ncbi:MAG TPA: hypothetical protein VF384_14935 [Planctomycetota bacterium]
MQALLSKFSILTLAATAVAQTALIPNPAVHPGGGNSGNIWRAGINRVQGFYDSTNFTGQGIGQPIFISGLEWRLIAALATSVTYPNVEIYLQPAAVDFLTPSTTFAANRTVAFPTTPNYAGPVTVNAGAAGTYAINIPLTTPFQYLPEAGQDLLIEIVILAAPTPLTGSSVDCGFNAPLHFCNSIRSVGSTTALTGSASAFAPIVRATYTNAPGAALNENIGAGCYRTGRSFYELFPGSANDLTNTTVTIVQNGQGGYTAITTPGALITPPTGVGLGLTDDIISPAQALPFTFNYPGGNSTTSIYVDSNGSINLNGAGISEIGGAATELLNSTVHRLAASMQDLLPDGATNVNNVYVDTTTVPGQALITWMNVPCFGQTTPTSTFQVALIDNGTNDTVEFRFVQLTNNSTSLGGVAITGFSLGGGAVDMGSSDLTAGPVSSSIDAAALALKGTSRPVLGTNWNLQVSNIPAGGALGLEIFGMIDPGVNDLAIIGMPGCGLRATLDVMNVYLPAGSTHNYSLPIPNVPAFVGTNVFTTSVMFVLPAPNAFGAISANGVKGTLGSL